MFGSDKQDSIVLVAYEPSWRDVFHAERDRLRTMFGFSIADVVHIGSTAIAGVLARPALDLLVGVPLLSRISDFEKPLSLIGYELVSASETGDTYQFIGTTRRNGMQSVLFVTRHNDLFWRHCILFRDYVSASKELCEQYSEIKTKHQHNARSYTKAKERFFQTTLKDAYTAQSAAAVAETASRAALAPQPGA